MYLETGLVQQNTISYDIIESKADWKFVYLQHQVQHHN